MFYVKEKTNNTEIRIEIDDENVFTVCPKCGSEFSVCPRELAKSIDFDLYSTRICCDHCSLN